MLLEIFLAAAFFGLIGAIGWSTWKACMAPQGIEMVVDEEEIGEDFDLGDFPGLADRLN